MLNVSMASLSSACLMDCSNCRYLKHRSTIVTTVRCVLLAFLTCLVPAIVEGSDAPPSRWIDSSGLWPLVVISLGLLVSQQFGFFVEVCLFEKFARILLYM